MNGARYVIQRFYITQKAFADSRRHTIEPYRLCGAKTHFKGPPNKAENAAKWPIVCITSVKLAPIQSSAGIVIYMLLVFSERIIPDSESSKPQERTIHFPTNRFAVAAEDIKAGELLLSEYPIVCGPYWDTRVNCLNCYQLSDTTCKWGSINVPNIIEHVKCPQSVDNLL